MKNFLTTSWLTSDNPVKEPVVEHAPVRVNMERMKEALAQESIAVPMGLSISQKIEFMMARAGAL